MQFTRGEKFMVWSFTINQIKHLNPLRNCPYIYYYSSCLLRRAVEVFSIMSLDLLPAVTSFINSSYILVWQRFLHSSVNRWTFQKSSMSWSVTLLLGFKSVFVLLSSTGPCCYFWMMMINHRLRNDTVRCTIHQHCLCGLRSTATLIHCG